MMLTLLSTLAAFAAPDSHRASIGLFGNMEQSADSVGTVAILSDKLNTTLSKTENRTVSLQTNLRLGFHAFNTWGALDKTRLRKLQITVERAQSTLQFGRFEVAGGGYRLADGVQFSAQKSEHLRLGFWAGAAADVYSTLPRASFGGGPTLAYHSDLLYIDGMMELLVGAGGLDRLSIATTGRADPTDTVDLRWRIDLDYGGSTQPIHINDFSLSTRLQANKRLQLNGFFDLYSAPFYLWSEKRDPSVKRFASRAVSRDPNFPIVTPQIDHSLYTLVGASSKYKLKVGDQTVLLKTRLRYRYTSDPSRRFARVSGFVQLPTLLKGTLDLSFEEAYLWWGGRPGTQSTLLAWLEPFENTPVSFDASVQVGTKRLAGESIIGLTNYADFYVDWLAPRGFMISAGYAFSDSRDVTRWDPAHALYLRTSWNLKHRKKSEDTHE